MIRITQITKLIPKAGVIYKTPLPKSYSRFSLGTILENKTPFKRGLTNCLIKEDLKYGLNKWPQPMFHVANVHRKPEMFT